jgi:predicted phosphoribosyltransferase
MFADRAEAGDQLGRALRELEWTDPTVLGMARGGVPVALRVAMALRAPLDVVVARKIGAPGQPELGLGAVTEDGPAYYDQHALAYLGLTEEELLPICERERGEARRRLQRYRQAVGPVPLADRDVILVDDGLATGVTARAAARQVRTAAPRTLVFAVPVCAQRGRGVLRAEVDDVVCLESPEEFRAVGIWYRDFAQTTDDEVIAILAQARCPRESGLPAH